MMQGTERRREGVKRFTGLKASVSLRMEVLVLDLSAEGALIEHGEPLSPGASYPLVLHLEGSPLSLRARVVWSQVHSVSKGGNGEGRIRFRSSLHFREVPEEAAARVQGYLRNLPFAA